MQKVDQAMVSGSKIEQQWWRSSSDDVLSRARTLGWHGSPDSPGTCVYHSLGRSWDGRSDLPLDDAKIPAGRIMAVINGLARRISRGGVRTGGSLGWRSVRRCYVYDAADDESSEHLVIDVDLGDFILPLALPGWCLGPETSISLSGTVSELFSWIEDAEKHRTALAGQEHDLRKSVEQVAAEIGRGFTPLWFRLTPKACFHYDSWPDEADYQLVVFCLDRRLEWKLHERRIETGSDLQGYKTHDLRRSTLRDILQRTGSAGLISEVALALIAEWGADVGDVFARLKASEAYYDPPKLGTTRNSVLEELALDEGVVRASISFDRARYVAGELKVAGQFPLTMAAGAKGIRLANFVDYDAFHAAGVIVTEGCSSRDSLDLRHEIWVIPVEDLVGIAPEAALGWLRNMRANPEFVEASGSAAVMRWRPIGSR